MITNEMLHNWFTYHPPSTNDVPKYNTIRQAAYSMAMILKDNTPSGRDQDRAIQLLRECVMHANAAVACGGAPTEEDELESVIVDMYRRYKKSKSGE